METKNIKKTIELIPQGKFISYRVFCNFYYRLARTLLFLSYKSMREGLLHLEDELEKFSKGFFQMGLEFVINGNDYELIKHVLTLQIQRESDYYRKKLMQIAMEGILFLHMGTSPNKLAILLTSLVNIEGNPLEAACKKYFAGDIKAFYKVDLKAFIKPENEMEEVQFIGRAITLGDIAMKEGLLAWEKHLDHNAIIKRDVFEYGIHMIIDNWELKEINKVLNALIMHETDPVKKNLAMAKKEAVNMLYQGRNPRLIVIVLGAYFDESIFIEVKKEFSYILE